MLERVRELHPFFRCRPPRGWRRTQGQNRSARLAVLGLCLWTAASATWAAPSVQVGERAEPSDRVVVCLRWTVAEAEWNDSLRRALEPATVGWRWSAGRGLTLQGELAADELPGFLESIASRAAAWTPRAPDPGVAAQAEALRRAQLLLPAPGPTSNWATQPQAAARASRADLPAAARALEGWRRPSDPVRASRAISVLRIDASPSRRAEVRCLAPVDAVHDAAWSIAASALAGRVEGWTFVPGDFEPDGALAPAYLYACGDVVSLSRRVEELRAAWSARERIGFEAARRRWVGFARARAADEGVRLRALACGREGELLAAAEAFELADAARVDWGGARWTLLGPSDAWRETAEALGRGERWDAAPPAWDAASETALQATWRSLGGVERWRNLARLRTLGSLLRNGERQGIEQWIDFAGERFALAQLIDNTETVVAASAAHPDAAWIVGASGAGAALEPAQARKLWARHERGLLSLLRRLAQPDHGGLRARFDGTRWNLFAEGRPFAWFEVDAQGLPLRSGYTLDGEATEALYEYGAWRLDAALPHPARTQQIDRDATSDLEFVEANAELDPGLWKR